MFFSGFIQFSSYRKKKKKNSHRENREKPFSEISVQLKLQLRKLSGPIDLSMLSNRPSTSPILFPNSEWLWRPS